MMSTITAMPSRLLEQAVQDRRYLHENPELSGVEYETCNYIRSRLESLDIEILDYNAPSVVGFIKGTMGGRTIALRADIDALPINEEGNKSYISKKAGVAHVCGHDGHTAILLAVAEWLSKNRGEVGPNVMLIFQSAEEITPSGADSLVKQGVLQNVDAIFGIHLWQGLAKGKIGLSHGPMMASTDDVEIMIKGSGGHGSMPHETVDPVYIATHVIQALQSIISRKLNPLTPGVISIGKVEAGTTYNIIPSSVKLSGTVRGLTYESVEMLRDNIKQLTEGICTSFGAKGEVGYIIGTPPLVNDTEQSQFVEEVICKYFGNEIFELVEPVMGGEDFAYYLLNKPGAFIFVGMGGEKSAYPHHHPQFDIDEEVMPNAIELFIQLVKNF
ncbi:M20 metallopeptidase family protein [Pseudalkalibacillus decolorationis]|uniref:M20 metallopeptidase family protein n=1 Tax=Pseudalkalibacillus decolorationis TaxID=163879 RepID=UPI002147CDA6|nr:amidohydrolase [Pseudalkalibacillus decolorationis]